ncbi:MAG: glycosyltransferase family 4 protein [Gemmatimonadaceae bacterium]|nr:glycosyltransferase family 4 protein [Gemmatimonadaceae bacterium]
MTTPMPLVWCAPIYEATGYADEARGIVIALEAAGIPVVLRPVAERQVPGFREQLPSAMASTLDRQAQRSATPPFLLVEHFVADGFVPTDAAAAVVGRTMFETDALPAAWVASCNALDALWVPSQFNVESFRRAGVHVPIAVVPGGIDSTQYTPDGPQYPVAGTRGTVFLSIFEWRRRKGWDVLLRAWADAFQPTDDVSLVLRTYLPGFGASAESAAWLEHAVNTFLFESCGRHRHDVAPIVLVPELVAEQDMPALYRAAHAYVSPTRGEGWGRPLMEAMSTGLPVIATRWSAHLEYMTDENSLLLDIDGLVSASDPDALVYRDTAWAEPSVSHLVRLLRGVHADRPRARDIGQRARHDMVSRWTWAGAASVVRERLRELHALHATVNRADARVVDRPGDRTRIVVDAPAFSSNTTPLELTALLAPLHRAAVQSVGPLRLNGTAADERPSIASPRYPLWRDRVTTGTVGVRARDIVLTWCSATSDSTMRVPPDATWVVCTGDAVFDHVPEWLAPHLLSRANDVWVPHAAAHAAVRELGVPESRVFRIPAMRVLDASQVAAFDSVAGVRKDARRRVLLPVSAVGDIAIAEQAVRMWPRVSGGGADLAIRIDRASEDAVREWGGEMEKRARTMRGLEHVSVWNERFAVANVPSLLRRADVLLSPHGSTHSLTWWRVARDLGCALIVPEHAAVSEWPAAGVWTIPSGPGGAMSGAALASALSAACTTDALTAHRTAMRTAAAALVSADDVAAMLVTRLLTHVSAAEGAAS